MNFPATNALDAGVDPTKLLADVLNKVKAVVAQKEAGPELFVASQKLAIAFAELHLWLAQGGDLPDQWRPCYQCTDKVSSTKNVCARHGRVIAQRP